MKIDELEKLAMEGKLKVEKKKWRIVYREKGWRGQSWEATSESNWDKTKIPYQIYSYEAKTPEMPANSFYKITKKDYEMLKTRIKLT